MHVCVVEVDELFVINFFRNVVFYNFRPFFTDQTLTSMSSSQGRKSYILTVNNMYAQYMLLMVLIN